MRSTRSPVRARVAAGALAAAVATALVAAAPAGDPLKIDDALDLIPADALGFVIMPDPKAGSDDVAQCLARMERPEAALVGRPIDLLKAQLGIGAGLDDAAPVVIWWEAIGTAAPVPVLVVGTLDPAQFLSANFSSAPDVAPDAWRRDGQVIYAKSIDKLVVMSPEAELARTYAPKPAFTGALLQRIGPRGMQMIHGAEVSGWAGPSAVATMRAGALEEAMRRANGQAAEIDRFAKVAEGMTDVVMAFDVDPLGLSVRSLGVFDPKSPLGTLTRGGPSSAVGVDRLPAGGDGTLVAVAIDVKGLGGGGPFLEFAKLLQVDALVPAWVSENPDLVEALQFGFYRSKLGYASGIFNDSAIFVRTADPARVKALVKSWIESMNTPDPISGVSRTPKWEAERALKSGGTVAAFEVEETGAPEGEVQGGMAAQLAKSFIVGPKGLRGFVKDAPDGLVITLSQRTDVLARASDAASGKNTLAGSGTVRALRKWLLPEPDVEAFIGVGPIAKMALSAAAAFGVAPADFEIPDKLEPIAFALSAQDGRVETASMIPTGVLALLLDQARYQAMPVVPEAAAPKRGGGGADANDGGEELGGPPSAIRTAERVPADRTVSATIISVRRETATTIAEVDVGARDGVQPGWTFTISNGAKFIGSLRVTTVDQTRATGVIELEDPAERGAVEIGQRASVRRGE